jgi:hypothetical protein
MKRVLVIAAALAIAAPASQALAANLAVGTVAAYNASECSFKLRSGAVFNDTDPEHGDCFPLATGDQIIVTYHRVGSRNEVDSVRRYEDEYALGLVEAITSDRLTLDTGAEFDITHLSSPPTVAAGDYVRIDFAVTMDGKDVATSVTSADLGLVNRLQQQQ